MKKGFTLIELLIVIGIIAILATAVLLVLNPAQILAETRDTQRLSDLDAVRGAMNLFLTTVASPVMASTGACVTNYWATVPSVSTPFVGGVQFAITAANLRTTAGAGWVPVNLSSMSGGSPLATLPVDPTNSTTYFYAYSCGAGSTYEVDAKMESTKYSSGVNNKQINTADGGTNDLFYEVGNNLAL